VELAGDVDERGHHFAELELHVAGDELEGREGAGGVLVGVRGRRRRAPVLGRRRRAERAALRRRAPPARRRRGEAEGRGGGPALRRLLIRRRDQPLGLHRQAGAQALQQGVDARVVLRRLRGRGGLACRRRRPPALDAGVRADVEDVEERRVLVSALHLLRRRASLGVAVRAAVVAPAEFARFRSGHEIACTEALVVNHVRGKKLRDFACEFTRTKLAQTASLSVFPWDKWRPSIWEQSRG
jgi:hypothetical protein